MLGTKELTYLYTDPTEMRVIFFPHHSFPEIKKSELKLVHAFDVLWEYSTAQVKEPKNSLF